MTIKEKVMKAWDKDAAVRIKMQSGRCFEGLIGNAFSELGGKSAVLLTSCNDEGEVTDHRHLPYKDITDIRFVEEEAPTDTEDADAEPKAWDCGQGEYCGHFPCKSVHDCPHYPDGPEGKAPALVAGLLRLLQEALADGGDVTVDYRDIAEKHSYAGNVRGISRAKDCEEWDYIIYLDNKSGMGATMYLSAITDVIKHATTGGEDRKVWHAACRSRYQDGIQSE